MARARANDFGILVLVSAASPGSTIVACSSRASELAIKVVARSSSVPMDKPAPRPLAPVCRCGLLNMLRKQQRYTGAKGQARKTTRTGAKG